MKNYYTFTNKHGEVYYAYGTEQEAQEYLGWLLKIARTKFTMAISEKEDERFAVPMIDILSSP
jgi:hypothetical protein